ncbi:hypothetical protein OPT61_g8440 [Boeremia exigua]|uniref:Uncharacterized protein n=1 Tax=Boeremia exigua TaxID=749465 RepID=A0ACC2HZ67_9PLEO|nr:hypothetical protein OPT61_g8440 [Boeremia exigua]
MGRRVIEQLASFQVRGAAWLWCLALHGPCTPEAVPATQAAPTERAISAARTACESAGGSVTGSGVRA